MRQDKTALILTLFFALLTVVGGVGLIAMLYHREGRNDERVERRAVAPPRFDDFAAAPNFAMPALPDPIVVGQGPPIAAADVERQRGNVVEISELKIDAPVMHGNLAVFMIHGPDQVKDAKILTLQEALDRGVAVVHDRGQLSIDNRSTTHTLFVQSGDIVKGGSQDRVLPYDQLIPPQTVNQVVSAFCVEQGRSGPRGSEISTSFSTSNEQLPGRQLKLAALYRKSQQQVWSQVQRTQANLSRNVGEKVNSAVSPTSLQLALENPRVEENTRMAVDKLADTGRGSKDVIGVVIAVNGQIQSADIYGSSELFQKAWPKLLRAAAVDALAALAEQSGAPNAAPTVEGVRSYLAGPNAADGSTHNIGASVRLLQQESGQTVRFDTCDIASNNAVLHRTYLTK